MKGVEYFGRDVHIFSCTEDIVLASFDVDVDLGGALMYFRHAHALTYYVLIWM